MAKKTRATQFDDWTVWEVLKMGTLKGNEKTLYNYFAGFTAARQLLHHRKDARTEIEYHEIVDIVKNTPLSQTQVRYAMGKLITKGLISKTKSHPVRYSSFVERKMARVCKLQQEEAVAIYEYGELDAMKETITGKIVKLEKKLRRMKKAISMATHHQEIVRFDKKPWILVDVSI
jgi:hypothetical protein